MSKIIFFFLILLLGSCKNNKHQIDVSNIDVEIEILRFEKDLFNIPLDSTGQYNVVLYPKYGEFYKRYVENILNVGLINDPMLGYSLQHFVTDPDINNFYTYCNNLFTDKEVEKIEKELTDAFKHYNYYFPNRSIPKIITFFSAFRYAVVTTKEYLGIGLDMYLGVDCEYYKRMGLPLYKISNMSKEYITTDAMKGWVSTEFEPENSHKNLLNRIIHYGKILYLLDALLPEVNDTIKIDYTAKQLQWCKENEFNIWSHFVDRELLFSTNLKKIMKYTSDGPFTSGFPEGAPARIGNWLGWQIVRAYMENHQRITLQQLINEKDVQEILNQSKYKPR